MPAPFTEEALWMTARLFINGAMDTDEHRRFAEQALWASLSLELLGNAALSRVLPLIAKPQEDGGNLLIASGLVEGRQLPVAASQGEAQRSLRRVLRPYVTGAPGNRLHAAGPGRVLVPRGRPPRLCDCLERRREAMTVLATAATENGGPGEIAQAIGAALLERGVPRGGPP